MARARRSAHQAFGVLAALARCVRICGAVAAACSRGVAAVITTMALSSQCIGAVRPHLLCPAAACSCNVATAPMWGMPALLGHRGTLPNAALGFAVAPPLRTPPRLSSHGPCSSSDSIRTNGHKRYEY